MGSQALISATVFIVGIWIAWQAGQTIAAGDLSTVVLAGLGCAGCAAAIVILRNWRTGFYFFVVWLMFEDLARKYMGNGLALFFGKDILAALTYLSLYAAIRKGHAKFFRPRFLWALAIFIALGTIQIFNPNSPHILYGLLGFKTYFFYIPLIWVGYAFARNEEDLRRFLVVNAWIAAVIGAVGIIQAIHGNSFLNPEVLAPELRNLGDLNKVTPISAQVFNLPDSVFVSTGRFGAYLILAFIVAVGAAGYLLLYSKRGRKIIFATIGILGAAVVLSGSRGSLVYVTASVLVLGVGFLWGAPWRWRQAHRLVKAIRRSVIMASLALAVVLIVFPEEAGSRLAFYSETLMPSSSSYEGMHRGWDYPLHNLMQAFSAPNWITGNGIGVASLGTQYVARLVKKPPLYIWVEEGFGQLIVELGILGPFLWILWAGILLHASWSVLRRLRETHLFPMGFAVFWYEVLMLYVFTWSGFSMYENYITNAYLWLLVGILFRLPVLLDDARLASANSILRRQPTPES